ncbi:hypothetical protein Tco_0958024 [Tanacetum coccineum]
MREFKECVEEIKVLDVQRSGLQFTWNQKPKGKDGLLNKIDRIMANLEFIDGFVGAHAIFKPYRISDHSPSVLNIPTIVKPKPRPFKFFNIITRSERCKEVVMQGLSLKVSGFCMFRVVKRLKHLKKPLRKLLYEKVNLHDNVKRLREEIDLVQTSLDMDPSNATLRDNEARSAVAFNEAVLMEERFLKQKAKIDWLREGDSNSAYFHKAVKSRISRSRIDVVANADGTIFENDKVAGQTGVLSLNGDPLSPFSVSNLRVAKSHYTYRLERRVHGSTLFTYHRYCSELELINLCFADDLFLFMHGDVNSASLIKDALEEFKDASGLIPSLPKSTAYFCNVLNHTKIVRELVEEVSQSRVQIRRQGSYRLGTKFMRGFLWCQGSMRKGKAKMAWDIVCLPKDKGGLGLRRLDLFNKALMVEGQSFLDISVASLWFDCWSSRSSLSNVISTRDVFRAGFDLSAKVWNHLKSFAGLSSSRPDFNHILSTLLSIAKRKSLRSVIVKLVVAASAYFVWHERNNRLFKNNNQSVKQLIECIMSSVRLKLLSCRFKKSNEGVRFAQL